MATDTIPRPASDSGLTGLRSPWVQLVIGIVCMVMVANYQYGWTLFVLPIGEKFGLRKEAIQVTFTLFVLFETWLVPAEGWLVHKFGAHHHSDRQHDQGLGLPAHLPRLRPDPGHRGDHIRLLDHGAAEHLLH